MRDDPDLNRMMIAALALQGMLTNPQSPDDFYQIVRNAVAYADALTKELDTTPAY